MHVSPSIVLAAISLRRRDGANIQLTSEQLEDHQALIAASRHDGGGLRER
jgi:hypothetical protein